MESRWPSGPGWGVHAFPSGDWVGAVVDEMASMRRRGGHGPHMEVIFGRVREEGAGFGLESAVGRTTVGVGWMWVGLA